MHGTMRIPRLLPGGAALAIGGLLLTGCSGSAAAKHPETDLHAKLPASVRDAGVLKIASDISLPPMEFKGQSTEPVGVDPEIAYGIGRLLGLRVEIIDTSFDNLLPGLQQKQYDLAMSAISDTRQRREGTDSSGKQVNPGVDFVDYFIAGSAILVPKGNPEHINTLDDLCGRTVAAKRGTVNAGVLQGQGAACARFQKTLTVKLFDTSDAAAAEIGKGHLSALLDDYPVTAYLAQNGRNGAQLQLAGSQLQPGPYGIAASKDNTALRDAVAKALDHMIQSGDYDKILAKWNVSAGAAQNAVINGGF